MYECLGWLILRSRLSAAGPGIQWVSSRAVQEGAGRGWLRTPVVQSPPSNYSLLDRMTGSHALSLACGFLYPRGSCDGLSGLSLQSMDLVCLWGGAMKGKSQSKPKIILKGFGGRSYCRSGFCQQEGLLCFPRLLAGQGFAKPFLRLGR